MAAKTRDGGPFANCVHDVPSNAQKSSPCVVPPNSSQRGGNSCSAVAAYARGDGETVGDSSVQPRPSHRQVSPFTNVREPTDVWPPNSVAPPSRRGKSATPCRYSGRLARATGVIVDPFQAWMPRSPTPVPRLSLPPPTITWPRVGSNHAPHASRSTKGRMAASVHVVPSHSQTSRPGGLVKLDCN